MKTLNEINESRKQVLKAAKQFAADLSDGTNDYVVVVLRDGTEYIVSSADNADDIKYLKYNQVSYILYWFSGSVSGEINGTSDYTDFGYDDTDNMVSAISAYYDEVATSSAATILRYNNIAAGASADIECTGTADSLKSAAVSYYSAGDTSDADFKLYESAERLADAAHNRFTSAENEMQCTDIADRKYYALHCIAENAHRVYNAINEIMLDAIKIAGNIDAERLAEIEKADTTATDTPATDTPAAESTDTPATDTDVDVSGDDTDDTDDDEVPAMNESDIRKYAEKDRSNCCYVLDAILDATGESSTMLLESLCRCLSVEVLAENLAYICRMYDIKESVAEYLHINGQI